MVAQDPQHLAHITLNPSLIPFYLWVAPEKLKLSVSSFLGKLSMEIHSLLRAEGIRTPKKSFFFFLKSLGLLICNDSVLQLGVQFEAPLAEVADECAGQQSHAGDGEQLQEPLPREQVVQR